MHELPRRDDEENPFAREARSCHDEANFIDVEPERVGGSRLPGETTRNMAMPSNQKGAPPGKFSSHARRVCLAVEEIFLDDALRAVRARSA
jgi:hypothetical protein